MHIPKAGPLALLIGLAASGAAAQPSQSALVASLLEKLAQLEDPAQRSQAALPISDAELNAFLNHGGEAFSLPDGVSDLQLRFERGRVWARGIVDLERLPVPADVEGLGTVLALVGSRFPVEVSARLRSEQGFARIEVERVLLAALPLPRAAIESLISSSTRSRQRPGGIDLDTPFRLPWALQRVILRPGQALLEF